MEQEQWEWLIHRSTQAHLPGNVPQHQLIVPQTHSTDGALSAESASRKASISSTTSSACMCSHFGFSFPCPHIAGGKYLPPQFEYDKADSVLKEHSVKRGKSCAWMSRSFICFLPWLSRNAELTLLSSQILLHFFHLYNTQSFRSYTGAAFKWVKHLVHKILHVLNSRESRPE